MELIIVSGISGLSKSQMIIRRFEQAGYMHIDPDMYLEEIPSDRTVELYQLEEAKKLCLQDIWLTVAKGSPVVINGDFINDSDLVPFHELECAVEYVDADTPLHSIYQALIHKRQHSRTPVSAHWMGFKLARALSA